MDEKKATVNNYDKRIVKRDFSEVFSSILCVISLIAKIIVR